MARRASARISPTMLLDPGPQLSWRSARQSAPSTPVMPARALRLLPHKAVGDTAGDIPAARAEPLQTRMGSTSAASRLDTLRQTLDTAKRCEHMDVPDDLLRRIDALQERNAALREAQEKNAALWKKQDELWRKALPDGSAPSCGSRSCSVPRGSSAHAHAPVPDIRVRAASSSRAKPAPLPRALPQQESQRRRGLPSGDDELAQRLRRFRELLQQQRMRGEAEEAMERKLAQRVIEPMSQFQRSLEVLAESQRCIQEEQQQRIQQLEAEGARQQQLYQEQTLELQEALLAQSLRREGELAAELQELEHEFEAVQAADARIRTQQAQLWPAGTPQDGLALSLLDQTGQMTARSRASMDAFALPFGPEAAALEQPTATAESWPQLTADLPRVYQESLAIILEHGWAALHGGRHARSAWTVLHWAAAQGRRDLCELLLQAEADPLHEDEEGRTALDCALEWGHQTTAALLAGEATPAPPDSRRCRSTRRNEGSCPFMALEGGSPCATERRLDAAEQRV